jgi:hypothetical protein
MKDDNQHVYQTGPSRVVLAEGAVTWLAAELAAHGYMPVLLAA